MVWVGVGMARVWIPAYAGMTRGCAGMTGEGVCGYGYGWAEIEFVTRR